MREELGQVRVQCEGEEPQSQPEKQVSFHACVSQAKQAEESRSLRGRQEGLQ
jgi:hypothetical protein